MKPRIIITTVVTIVLVGVVMYSMFMGRAAQAPIRTDSLLLPLPTSPLNATVKIGETELALVDGKAETDIPNSSAKTVTTVVGEPVIGDVNDDGVNDTVMILTQNGGGSGTFHYVAAALKSDLGYMGTNAVLLGDRIIVDKVRVENGVIKISLATQGEGQAMTDTPNVPETKYVVLTTPLLEAVNVGDAEYAEGNVSYTADDVWKLAECGGSGAATVSQDSRSFAALQAIYTARSKNDEPVFVTMLAKRTQGKSGEVLDVERVLTVPTQGGVCGAVPQRTATPVSPDVASSTQLATTTTDNER
jgi:hypothetical protein